MKRFPSCFFTVLATMFMGFLLSSCAKTIAQVGNDRITTSDIKARLESIPSATVRNSPATPRNILDALIREKLVNAMAKKAGLDKKTFLQNLLSNELAVTDREIRDYSQTNASELHGQSQNKEIIRAMIQRKKFDAWLELAKATIPVTIDETALNNINASKL